MKIGLLSDTHGFIHPQVTSLLNEVDEIWHAGDFGAGVAAALNINKPLRGVYGNIDGLDVRRVFPEWQVFTVAGLKVVMVHIGGYPGKYTPLGKRLISEHKPGLFVSGHSHIVKIMPDVRNGLLHINPGAAGRVGWHKVATLVRFSIKDSRVHNLELIELSPAGRLT